MSFDKRYEIEARFLNYLGVESPPCIKIVTVLYGSHLDAQIRDGLKRKLPEITEACVADFGLHWNKGLEHILKGNIRAVPYKDL